jgi:hypothetical protein
VTAHTKVFQVIEGRNIPDWKKFLSVKENNQALENQTSWSETTLTTSGFPNELAM